MSKRITKAAFALFFALILIYVLYQVYLFIYPTYKTEKAVNVSVLDCIETEGIAVRDEVTIDTSAGGIKNFLVNDGDKIAKGSVVAEVFASKQAAIDNLALAQLADTQKMLEGCRDKAHASGTNIDSLTNQIYSATAQISQYLSEDNIFLALQHKNKTADMVNTFDVLLGKKIDPTAGIDAIAAQRLALQQNNAAPLDYIYSSSDGYFVALTDGYEPLVNKSLLSTMTAAQTIELIEGEKPQNTEAGGNSKIVSDYIWNFAAAINPNDAKRFVVGTTLLLDFGSENTKNIPAVIKQIKQDSTSDRAVVIFECDYLNSSLTGLRVEEVTIRFREYKGFKVMRNSLRLEENVLGVFVKYGSTAIFKQLDVIYENEEYLISRVYTSNETFLSLYDEVIVEGKDISVNKEL
ncbi:MAG: HlyD family efflux transporter periplasmic adaptor subunit [Oscillospiraceae bacterium]